MKRIIIEAVILVFAFFATIFGVNALNNRGKEHLSTEMSEATLPVVYMNYGDTLINCMHGYISDVDASMLEGGITPLDENHSLHFWIENSVDKSDKLSYEVRDLKDYSLIEDGEISNLIYEGGYSKGDIAVRMDLDDEREYLLVIVYQKENEKQKVKYYSEIMDLDKNRLSDFMKYAVHFSNLMLDKEEAENERAKELYLQTDETGNNSDLSHVNIHSNIDTLTYADLNPTRITQAIPYIKDLSLTGAVIEMKFILAAETEVESYYSVTETFQLGLAEPSFENEEEEMEAESDIRIVDYERRQEETFDYKNADTNKNFYRLGVGDDQQMEYMTSDGEKKIAFVREGQLWYYDYSSGRISLIFGFWQNNHTDLSIVNDQNAIKVLNIDDEGNIAFAAIGYMNRGDHEGQNGIAVYRYNASNYQIEEIMFLEQTEPFQILNGYASKLLYLNSEDVLYIMLDNCIFSVEAATGKISTIVSNVAMEDVSVSENGCLVAYPTDGNIPRDTKSMVLTNFETGYESEIKAEKGCVIKSLGFVENDFVYGVAKKSDIVVNDDGTDIFPMFKVVISDLNFNILKEYEVEDVYVMTAYTDDRAIYFNRAKKVTEDKYEETSQDFISYKTEDSSAKIEMDYVATSNALNALVIQFPGYIYFKSIPKLIMTKVVLDPECNQYTIDAETDGEYYYVYVGGKVKEITKYLTVALKTAEDGMGYVVDHDGNTIWKYSMIQEYNTINYDLQWIQSTKEASEAACLAMMIRYEGNGAEVSTLASSDLSTASKAADVLAEYLPEKQVVNCSGADLSQALFYLSNNAPIMTQMLSGEYVIISSYNSEQVRYISPIDGTDHVRSREMFEEDIKNRGSIFISYVK